MTVNRFLRLVSPEKCIRSARSFFYVCLCVVPFLRARGCIIWQVGFLRLFSPKKKKRKRPGRRGRAKKKLGTREKQKGRRDPFKSRLQLYAPDPGSFRHVVVMERHGTNPLWAVFLLRRTNLDFFASLLFLLVLVFLLLSTPAAVIVGSEWVRLGFCFFFNPVVVGPCCSTLLIVDFHF